MVCVGIGVSCERDSEREQAHACTSPGTLPHLRLAPAVQARLLELDPVRHRVGQDVAAHGHVGVADRFNMVVTFESDTRGMVRYSIKDGDARNVPMCKTQVNDKKVSFVIDPSGQTNCSTLARPLRFQGLLGAHVITGDVTSNGAPVGVWRAYRRPKK